MHVCVYYICTTEHSLTRSSSHSDTERDLLINCSHCSAVKWNFNVDKTPWQTITGVEIAVTIGTIRVYCSKLQLKQCTHTAMACAYSIFAVILLY